MLRSMFSAVAGIKNHQIKLDVIGNNIANVNTIGFKASRVNFQDMLSQTIRSGAPPQTGRGGVNPAQVGLGMFLGSIDNIHTQGSIQSTDRVTDLAIEGNGFFVVSDGNRRYYTRDGTFTVGLNGDLVNSANGLKVQGWIADERGVIDTDQQVTNINIGLGQRVMTRPTAEMVMGGNLNADSAVGTVHRTYIDIFDSLGKNYELEITFTKTTDNEWDWLVDSSEITLDPGTFSGTVVFDSYGMVDTVTGGPLTITGPPSGAADMEINLDFNDMTQVVGANSGKVLNQDGYPAGELNAFTISKTGVITGSFSNGLVSPVAQIALAFFSNPEGLSKIGNNLYETSGNSGFAMVGIPGRDGRGIIETFSLEMANVDLATEFTQMITTSRAYQANSRVVTTSDEMLQELMHLKR